jgi:hypothetical protein
LSGQFHVAEVVPNAFEKLKPLKLPSQLPSQILRKLGLIVHEGGLVLARLRSSEAYLAKRLTPFN